MSLIEIQSRSNFHLPYKVFIVVIPLLTQFLVVETFQHEWIIRSVLLSAYIIFFFSGIPLVSLEALLYAEMPFIYSFPFQHWSLIYWNSFRCRSIDSALHILMGVYIEEKKKKIARNEIDWFDLILSCILWWSKKNNRTKNRMIWNYSIFFYICSFQMY